MFKLKKRPLYPPLKRTRHAPWAASIRFVMWRNGIIITAAAVGLVVLVF